MQAFGGGLGSLLQRPKPEEVVLISKQRRLEPFWHVAGRAVYRLRAEPRLHHSRERGRRPGDHHPRQQVRGRRARGRKSFRVPVREHCRAEFVSESYTDGLTGGPVADAAALMVGPRSEVSDPATLSADGTIAPRAGAPLLIRRPAAHDRDHEARPGRPDARGEHHRSRPLTCSIARSGRSSSTGRARARPGSSRSTPSPAAPSRARPLVGTIKQMLSRDVLFDIGADTVGLFVPGGSIAVKLAKAAIDTQRQ